MCFLSLINTRIPFGECSAKQINNIFCPIIMRIPKHSQYLQFIEINCFNSAINQSMSDWWRPPFCCKIINFLVIFNRLRLWIVGFVQVILFKISSPAFIALFWFWRKVAWDCRRFISTFFLGGGENVTWFFKHDVWMFIYGLCMISFVD